MTQLTDSINKAKKKIAYLKNMIKESYNNMTSAEDRLKLAEESLEKLLIKKKIARDKLAKKRKLAKELEEFRK